ncbi:MAG: ABC transporter substrate-binding protein, partial [Chloroflexota bacterium]
SNAASLAGPELAGVRIAADLINRDGGIAGRRVVLEVRDLRARGEAAAVMADLKRSGVEIVIGAYSSDLSIAASEAASRAGLLYWEAGAVADRLTGRGLPMVFRVGASGANLGANSSNFAASELAARLGKRIGDLRVAIAVADDAYANAVADAAQSTADARGMPVVLRRAYSLTVPDFPAVMRDLEAARPDVIILASHIPDGIAFRQEMVRSGLRVGALIGSTMAECDPDFAGELGTAAVGIFASERPTAGFQSSALTADAAATYARFEAAWAAVAARTGGSGDGTGGYERSYGNEDAEYTIHGPDEDATAEESEEALAGFSAAWALFHHVLPARAAPALVSATRPTPATMPMATLRGAGRAGRTPRAQPSTTSAAPNAAPSASGSSPARVPAQRRPTTTASPPRSRAGVAQARAAARAPSAAGA